MSPPLPSPPPPTVNSSVRLNAAPFDVSGNPTPPNSILYTRQPALQNSLTRILNTRNVQYTVDLTEEDIEPDVTSQTMSRLLLSLLAAPLGSVNRRGGLDAFLQPVEVRPTAEQIMANTTVGNLVSDEDHSCAICQDTLTPEQEGRKLNACGHWFHRNCIDTWFDRDVHCPVCRHDIREPAPSS